MLAALGTLASVAIPKIMTFVSKKLSNHRVGHAAAKIIKHADMIGRKVHHISQHPAMKQARKILVDEYKKPQQARAVAEYQQQQDEQPEKLYPNPQGGLSQYPVKRKQIRKRSNRRVKANIK